MWVKKLQHAGVTHAQGGYKMLPDGNAVEIICAAHNGDSYYLLCKELQKKAALAEGFTCWICPQNSKPTLLPMDILNECNPAALKRAECKNTHKQIYLLLG